MCLKHLDKFVVSDQPGLGVKYDDAHGLVDAEVQLVVVTWAATQFYAKVDRGNDNEVVKIDIPVHPSPTVVVDPLCRECDAVMHVLQYGTPTSPRSTIQEAPGHPKCHHHHVQRARGIRR